MAANLVHFFGNGISERKTFQQGVPQGSFISPILFLIFIDDSEEQIDGETLLSMFADDVVISATRRTLEERRRDVQAALDAIACWSKQGHLTISEAKFEATFFTTFGPEMSWTPSFQINGKEIATPKPSSSWGLRMANR